MGEVSGFGEMECIVGGRHRAGNEASAQSVDWTLLDLLGALPIEQTRGRARVWIGTGDG